MAMTVRYIQGGFAMSLNGLKQRFGHLDQDAFAQQVAQAWLDTLGANAAVYTSII